MDAESHSHHHILCTKVPCGLKPLAHALVSSGYGTQDRRGHVR